MRKAVSMSTKLPSAMLAKAYSGAGSKPRVCLSSMAGATLKAFAKAGVAAVPPGMRQPFSSKGCCAVGLAAIQASAAASISAGAVSLGSTSWWMSPKSAPWAGLNNLPSTTYGCALMRPSKRDILVAPLAPGNKPKDTSGKPSCVRGLLMAMR